MHGYAEGSPAHKLKRSISHRTEAFGSSFGGWDRNHPGRSGVAIKTFRHQQLPGSVSSLTE
jgi:hypothetical protein